MKKIILILFLFSIAEAKPKKAQKIKNLENALRACVSSKEVLSDTLYIEIDKEPTRKEIKAEIKCNKVKSKHEVEKAKIEAKKEIVLAKQETKSNKSDNKTEVKTSVVFQFFSTLKRGITSLTLGQMFGSGKGLAGMASVLAPLVAMVEKFKPLTKLLSIFKSK
jgi:hypothetical protein